MGNALCCTTDSKNEKANLNVQPNENEKYEDYNEWTLEKFIKVYEKGDKVKVAFPDGNEICCHLKLYLKEKCLELSLDNKVRVINFNDISCVLDKNNCETLLESEKNLLRSPNVLGIRLTSTFKAIAFSMDSASQAQSFSQFIKKYCLS